MGLADIFYRLGPIQKILLIAGFYTIIFTLYYLMVLSSFEFDSLARDIINVGKDIDIEQGKLKKAEEVTKSIEQQKSLLKELVESLPTKQDFDATSEQLDNLANEVGVKMLRLAPAKEELNKEYSVSKIPFNLTLYGEYKKLGIFFQKLDQMPKLVHVDALTLQPKQGKVIKRISAVPLDATVVVATYRRLPEEEIQAMSQQTTKTTAPKK